MGRHKYGPGNSQPQATRERNAEMADMYRSGMKLQEIGNVFALTRERVRQVLFKQGIVPNEIKTARRAELRLQVQRLARQGLTKAQIVEKLGKGTLQLFHYKTVELYRFCELCGDKFKLYHQHGNHKLCLICTTLHGHHWSHVKAMVKSHHPIMLKALNRLSKDWLVKYKEGHHGQRRMV